MRVYELEKSRLLRKHGMKIGREGLAVAVIHAINVYQENESYKNAMALAGALKAIAQAAKCDEYWTEQVDKGFKWQLAEFGI